MRDKHKNDPRDAASGGNLAANNPLMASEGSPWELYFRNQEVRDTIALDLERLHPGDEFYSSGDVQAALLDVLTVWSLENPSIGYRQGMHELAALVFSQRAADAAGLGHPWGSADAPPADPVVDGAPELSAAYVEHDAYAMFAALMGPTRADRPSAADETTPVRMAAYFEDPPKRGAASEVQAACDRVFRTLGAVDKPLRDHLESLGIEPQLFLLRWLRVLFTREFHLHDALHVWDATFAANAADAADASYAFDSRVSTRGGVRDFIEAFAVAMLLFVRADVLAQDDFARLRQTITKVSTRRGRRRARRTSEGHSTRRERRGRRHLAPRRRRVGRGRGYRCWARDWAWEWERERRRRLDRRVQPGGRFIGWLERRRGGGGAGARSRH